MPIGMTPRKVQIAQWLGWFSVIALCIAVGLLVEAAFRQVLTEGRQPQSPRNVLIMAWSGALGLLTGFLHVLTILAGWILPDQRPVYFARLRVAMLTFLSAGITGIFLSVAVYRIDGQDVTFDPTAGIAVLSLVIGLTLLGFLTLLYLWGWTSETMVRNEPMQGRIGASLRVLATWVAVATFPVSLITVLVAYVDASRAEQGWFALLAPDVMLRFMAIGLGIAAILWALGWILTRFCKR